MANEVYVASGTALTWTDDTTGGDYTLDVGSLAADAVRIGDRGDLGVSPRPYKYEWAFICDGFGSTTSLAVGETIDIYLSTSDGTYAAGDVGTTDAAGATGILPNLIFLGSAVVEQTATAGDDIIVRGFVEIYQRYVSPVIHNNTGEALLGTSDAHRFILTPVPDQIQAA